MFFTPHTRPVRSILVVIIKELSKIHYPTEQSIGVLQNHRFCVLKIKDFYVLNPSRNKR